MTRERVKPHIFDDLPTRKYIWQKYANDPDNNPCFARTPGKRAHAVDGTLICDVGDSVLFNALLCYSGNTFAADAIRRSQDNTGRWWRSPMHVDAQGKPTNYPGNDTSFSKDHALGVLLYFVTTADRNMARRQANSWLEYIQHQQSLPNKIKIGTDIPAPILGNVPQSLQKCADGLKENGCVINDIEERSELVWKKIQEGAACIADPISCLTQVWETVKVEVPKDIAYFTNNLCPDPNPGDCTITPGLWFLFHRVWRDSLGLTPSANMEFANSLFGGSDDTYDAYVAWEASGNSGFALHLAAVNALTRAAMGKPVPLTVACLYSKNPENLFYQYLRYKYVVHDANSIESMRSQLLQMAPSQIDKIVVDDEIKFKNSYLNGDTNFGAGNQWCWERDDVAASIKDTMGWDCIFIANLLTSEIITDLDYYKANVLPPLLDHRRSLLNSSSSILESTFGVIEARDKELGEFISQAATIISYPTIKYVELEAISRLISQKQATICSVRLGDILQNYRDARLAYEALLRLQEQSREKFQDAERLPEFNDIWNPVMAAYSEVPSYLERVQLYLEGKSTCSKLDDLLAAIPLRIEYEKIKGTNDDLKKVSQEILDTLRQVAANQEYSRVKETLLNQASTLATSLESLRVKKRYTQATVLAGSVTEAFEVYYQREVAEVKLITTGDLSEIRADVISVINNQIAEWAKLVNEFGAAAIIQSRLSVINQKVAHLYQTIKGLAVDQQWELFRTWSDEESQAGYDVSDSCTEVDDTSPPDSQCWMFNPPSDSSDDGWIAFDTVIDELERLVDDMGRILTATLIRSNPRTTSSSSVSTGVFFDVSQACTLDPNSRDPRYVDCSTPAPTTYQADPVSDAGSNPVVRNLVFFNRLVIVSEGEALSNAFWTWNINGQNGDQSIKTGGKLDVMIPVPYQGASLLLTGNGLDSFNVFKPNTIVNVVVNYAIPDTKSLGVYAEILGKYAKYLSKLYKELAPGSQEADVIVALGEGIDILTDLRDRDDNDAVTRQQIATAIQQMQDARAAITKACDQGGPDLCSQKIRDARESLSSAIRDAATELGSLREFLDAEITRLNALDKDVATTLKNILNKMVEPTSLKGVDRVIPSRLLIPRKKLGSDDDQFVRGELVTYKEMDAGVFSNPKPGSLIRNPYGDSKYVGDLKKIYWEWAVDQPAGAPPWSADFDGIDNSPCDAAIGPGFSVSGTTAEAREVNVFFSHFLASRDTMTRWAQAGRKMLIVPTLRCCAIPGGMSNPGHKSIFRGFVLASSSGSEFGGSLNFSNRPDYNFYFEETSSQIELDVAKDFPPNQDLVIHVYMAGRQVQFEMLTYLLLNPF